MKNRAEKKNKILIKLISSALMACIALIMFGTSVFAWFSANRMVSSNGMKVEVVRGQIDVFAKLNGEWTTVGYDDYIPGMNQFDNGSENTSGNNKVISPGSSGKIEFKVTRENLSSYGFSCRVFAKNNEFADNEGFLESVNSESEKRDALTFLGTHIMFFRNKDADGKYSGWLDPEEHSFFFIDGDPVVTLYWVWVPFYSDLFAEDSVFASEADLNRIRDEYGENENGHPEKMFHGNNVNTQGYNEADFKIGMTVAKVCFFLEVQGN